MRKFLSKFCQNIYSLALVFKNDVVLNIHLHFELDFLYFFIMDAKSGNNWSFVRHM